MPGPAAGSRRARRTETSPLTTAASRSSRARGEQVVPFVRPAHAPHPAAPVTDADHAHHAAHPLVERSRPDRRGAAVACAVEAEARPVDPRPGLQEGEGGLHVGDTAEGREPGARPLARPPALVVEGKHHVARLRQHPRIVGQIEALHPGIAVAEHDAGAGVLRAGVGRPVEIAGKPDALAVEAHALAPHGACLISRHSFDVHENLRAPAGRAPLPLSPSAPLGVAMVLWLSATASGARTW